MVVTMVMKKLMTRTRLWLIWRQYIAEVVRELPDMNFLPRQVILIQRVEGFFS